MNSTSKGCDFNPGTPPHVPTGEMDSAAIAAIILGALLVIGGIGFAVYSCTRKAKKNPVPGSEIPGNEAENLANKDQGDGLARSDSEKQRTAGLENSTPKNIYNTSGVTYNGQGDPAGASINAPLKGKMADNDINDVIFSPEDAKGNFNEGYLEAERVKKTIKPKKL